MTFKEINEKYGQDPSVCAEMKACTSVEEVYKILTEKYGYTGTIEDLTQEATAAMKINSDNENGEIDEEVLDTVVGGGSSLESLASMLLI